MASYRYCSPYGRDFSSLWLSLRIASAMLMYGVRLLHNRGEPIRVASVVVVDVTARVDIPSVISIASISTTQTHVLRDNLRPFVSFNIGLMP